jgi:hypothetical protein
MDQFYRTEVYPTRAHLASNEGLIAVVYEGRSFDVAIATAHEQADAYGGVADVKMSCPTKVTTYAHAKREPDTLYDMVRGEQDCDEGDAGA